MKISRILSVSLFVAGVLPAAVQAGSLAAKVPKKVLLVYSYNEAYLSPYTVPFMRAMNLSPFRCEYTVVNLQTQEKKKTAGPEEVFRPVLAEIRTNKFDAVIALHSPAFMLLCSHAADLPPSLPIIFSRVTEYEGIPSSHRNMTGSIMKLSPGTAADLAFQLFPQRKQLILVTGANEGGREFQRRLDLYVKTHPGISCTVLRGEEMDEEEALAEIEKLHKKSVLLYFSWYCRKQQQIDLSQKFLGRIAIWADVPIIQLQGMDESYYDVIGSIASGRFSDYGEDAAKRLTRVLGGVAANSIPISEMPVSCTINYPALRNWHLDTKNLPHGAVLLGKKQSFWIQYEREIVSIGGIVFLLLVSAALISLFFLLERRRALHELQKSQNKLEKSFSELNRALKAAQAADRAKSYFLASMSHEIRTPLNSIIGFTELLHDDTLALDVRHDYLDSIGVSANALLLLLNDVLDLSTMESRQLEITLSKTDLRALCADLIDIFQPEACHKGISLTCEKTSLPFLYVDQRRMRQIFWNIIGNAVKFTERGSVNVNVSFVCGTGAKKGLLSFLVKDTGPGIPKEDLAKITEPFIQSTRMRGTNSGKSGTGLGLAVTRRLIERMGGHITLESELGKGSRIGIVLPDVPFEPQTGAPAVKEPAKAVIAPKQKTVLVVDDVPMNVKVLAAHLKKTGMAAITAGSGEEALRRLHEMHADLVFTDLWMPAMNGEQLARNIRTEWKKSSPKIIAVTADTDAAKSFDLSVFDDIVHKPITQDCLSRLVNA